MMFVLALAASAVGSLAFSGYLVGAKRGQRARTALLEANEASRARVHVLEKELSSALQEVSQHARNGAHQGNGVKELQRELRMLAGAVQAREDSQDALKREIQGYLQSMSKGTPDAESLRRELHKMMTPLLQRENDTRSLREMMRELAGPMLEKQRLGKELSQLETNGSGLGELPRLLDSIADKGGFESVVLSDDVGLPLAASSKARDVESFAGFSALLLTVADRIAASGAPAPVGIVVRDAAERQIIYRIFAVGESRFMLTAVARGMFLAPEALDPALAKLERALTKSREDWS